MTCKTPCHVIKRGNTVVILAYITGVDQTAIVRADVSSIAYVLTKLATGQGVAAGEEVDSGALLKTDVIFDTLQTDYGWPLSKGPGYNLRVVISGALLIEPNTKYYDEITVTDTASLPNVFGVELVTDNPVG